MVADHVLVNDFGLLLHHLARDRARFLTHGARLHDVVEEFLSHLDCVLFFGLLLRLDLGE